MVSAEQIEFESYRVIVLGRDGSEILLVPDGGKWMLPSVEVPRWQRIAEILTEAVRSEWGEEVVCLFEPTIEPPPNDGLTRYQAVEHLRMRGNPQKPTRWLSISTLCPDSFVEAPDCAAIKQAAEVCRGQIEATFSGPFAHLGWLHDLSGWIESVTRPMGIHLTGSFRQLNASPSFCLIRFETDGPAIWFKAVGEPNQREVAVTCLLSRLFPSQVPRVLAVRPEWQGWLTREAEGDLLCDVEEIRGWRRVAAELAEIQINSCNQASELFAAGARDLRVGTLSKPIRHFVDTTQQLMQRQSKIPPPILEPKELLLLGDRIRAAFDVVESTGIPNMLGHLDFNPGNVVVSPQSCVFLDWAEAYVGNPFLTFQYLLEHYRRKYGNESNQESELVQSYVAPWLRLISREAIAANLAVSPLLAVFSYACGTGMLTDGERLKNPEFAGYLRSLVRRMDREARAWVDRNSKCAVQVVA